MTKTVCVFTGSSMPTDTVPIRFTEKACTEMALMGWNAVYGSGAKGLMGVSMWPFLVHERKVTGIMPEAAAYRELASKVWQKLTTAENQPASIPTKVVIE